MKRKLALVCGMFGSRHVGECAAAALKAHEIVHELGVTSKGFAGTQLANQLT
jgi:hypothetical protein